MKERKKKEEKQGCKVNCISLPRYRVVSSLSMRGMLASTSSSSSRWRERERQTTSGKRGGKDNKLSQTNHSHLLSSLVASSTISLLGDFLRSRMAVVKSFLAVPGAPASPASPPSTEGFFLLRMLAG